MIKLNFLYGVPNHLREITVILNVPFLSALESDCPCPPQVPCPSLTVSFSFSFSPSSLPSCLDCSDPKPKRLFILDYGATYAYFGE